MLTAASRRYHEALAADPSNRVAHRRLGQIDLSLGDYESAKRHLAVAYQADPGYATTRQMYGESLALSGRVDEAAAIWADTPLDQGQLDIRQQWYDSLGDGRRAEAFRQAVMRLSSRSIASSSGSASGSSYPRGCCSRHCHADRMMRSRSECAGTQPNS